MNRKVSLVQEQALWRADGICLRRLECSRGSLHLSREISLGEETLRLLAEDACTSLLRVGAIGNTPGELSRSADARVRVDRVFKISKQTLKSIHVPALADSIYRGRNEVLQKKVRKRSMQWMRATQQTSTLRST